MTHSLTDADYWIDAFCMANQDGLTLPEILVALNTAQSDDEGKTISDAEAYNVAVWATIRLKGIAADHQRFFAIGRNTGPHS